MFTERRISLSELVGPLGIDVHRDAEIAYVGKIPTRLPNRLVPAGRQSHLNEALRESGITAYVVPEELASQVPDGVGVVVSDRPLVTARQIHEHLCMLPGFHWEDFDSRIDPTAVVMSGAYIAPKNVVVGPRTRIGPNAVILERTIIGSDCDIGPGVAMGGDAFEQAPGASPKRILKQAGGVLLDDHVTIQSNCTIIRATFGGFTRLGRETKLDSLVHVAHDCELGERVTITACSELSGRVLIGDDAYLGPNCSVSNGVTIGAGATVTIGSVVVRDVPESTRVTGNFALPHQKWLNFIRTFR